MQLSKKESLIVKKLNIFILFSLLFTSCDSPEVSSIKTGSLGSCSDRTVDEIVSCYMASPSWESIVATDGNTYVNVTGGIQYDGKDVNALLQFLINPDDTFEANAFELNGIPQNFFLLATLTNEMCECK